MTDYTKLVPLPAPQDINSGLHSCRASTLRSLLGEPRAGKDYSQDCAPITGKFARRIVTRDFGTFKATGLDAALDSLGRVLERIKETDPELWNALGTAGMTCCRHIRGSSTALSNHSWGTAIDLTVNGKLPERGDGKVMLGMLKAYPHFHAEGWYWGAEFPTEDDMHFELADETARALLK